MNLGNLDAAVADDLAGLRQLDGRVDNRRTNPVEPASPVLDLDLVFLGCIGLLAAMIGEPKMGHGVSMAGLNHRRK
ncbi:hypothetical protein OA007_01190 [SAR116 cluster bacterium]|nr:hypothetical protein [SAR116 cluster bacterium]